ncbi:glycine receptor subunit alpha-2-like [Stegodyphus dumicola]|uniref:glycine receptor subunit alpha-2-like n=1 Tax=Stegodyphus dumicola TaxID=202533 RepID=UPI0015ABF938|nr:glycine receptor subunit alpha-2-like [Stegodyphus dumicola]
MKIDESEKLIDVDASDCGRSLLIKSREILGRRYTENQILDENTSYIQFMNSFTDDEISMSSIITGNMNQQDDVNLIDLWTEYDETDFSASSGNPPKDKNKCSQASVLLIMQEDIRREICNEVQGFYENVTNDEEMENNSRHGSGYTESEKFAEVPKNQYIENETSAKILSVIKDSLPEEELLLRWTKKGVGILEDMKPTHNKFKLVTPVIIGHMKLKYDGPDVSGYFSCVNASFSLERQNGYQLGYSYTVTSFIVVVSWISFWLPVTAVPARVTLGVTTLLTLLTTANFVRSSLPPITYVTAIDVWVGTCTVFVFAALLLFPISHYFSQKNQKLRLERNKIYPVDVRCKFCSNRKVFNSVQESEKQGFDIDGFCRKLFPFFFIIFNISYWSYYVPKSNEL